MPRLPRFFASREQIWRQLAAELEARYTEGGFLESDRVEVGHGPWTIVLDTYFCAATKVTHTRLRAPYVNPDGFRFMVCRRGMFTELAKLLGAQDVEVGHEAFDRDFVIKGNDEARLRELFADEELRRLLEEQPRVHFSVTDDDGRFRSTYPPDTDLLTFHAAGVIKDVERLHGLFALMAATLDRLCAIGSAYEDAPGVGS